MNLFHWAKSKGQSEPQQLKFYKNRKEIISLLKQSKETGIVLGIYSSALGDGMYLTGVRDLHKEGSDVIVSLHRVDKTGLPLMRDTISVDEIRMLCPFEEQYVNPITSTRTLNSKLSTVG